MPALVYLVALNRTAETARYLVLWQASAPAIGCPVAFLSGSERFVSPNHAARIGTFYSQFFRYETEAFRTGTRLSNHR